MRPRIVVVGCGLVGAMVAYELNRQLVADITVLEKSLPAQGSTGAALGVLMGVISHKVKGRTWRLREASTRRYKTLIEELAQQGETVPFNHQGIVSLCFDEGKLSRWETLKEKRKKQGWPLEIWSPEEVQARCPQVALESLVETESKEDSAEDAVRTVKAAIYSAMDGQVHPAELARSLSAVAGRQGVRFCSNAEVTELWVEGDLCRGVRTTQGDFSADWVVVCAGLGSAALTQFMDEPLALMPVLGQAMEIQLPEVLGDEAFQPVINGEDIQFVPLGEGRYWLGATVEFPKGEGPFPLPMEVEAQGLENLQRGAARFCPAIREATVLDTWSGLRPRPVGQPAPVIKPLGSVQNVTLATGHYRNGVLLAPATAQQVCDLLSSALMKTSK
ncbi:MAG: FAD-dependent oxidoreductase [Cyanobacteria bacterium J06576_12]